MKVPSAVRAPSGRFFSLLTACAACLISVAAFAVDEAVKEEANDAAAKAQAPVAQAPAAAGRLVRVPLPITGTVDIQVERAVKRAIAQLPRERADRPVIVLEFSAPKDKGPEGSSFARSFNLAKFLAGPDLSGIKTVAFIPKAVKGHAVLAVIACEEIVMAPDAELGEAGIDEPAEKPIGPATLGGYTEIVESRRTVPFPIARGMLDREVEVIKAETDVSIEYVLSQDLPALKEKRAVQSTEILKRPNELGSYTGRRARELGFAKYLATDRAALAKALELPNTAIQDDPSLGGEWRPIRIPLTGELKPHVIARVERMIDDQVRLGQVNFICFVIDSPGGARTESVQLANRLSQLDSATVRTVAYIPGQAGGDATVIALACDEIVMHPEARIGGGTSDWPETDIEDVRRTMQRNLAEKESRSWSLPLALLDGQLDVYQYTDKKTGFTRYLSANEAAELGDNAGQQGDEITTADGPLVLSGVRAEELDLASHVVDDFDGLREMYNLERDPALVEPGWADHLIDALAAPGIAYLLLFIGAAALYAELQSPGIGVGAFVAGICFLLYFWSQHLNGTAGWLEALLFIAGIVCILLEIFVLPGAAIFGLGGGLLVLASLILASQTFVFPHNSYEVVQLRDTLVSLLAVGVGLVIAIAAMRRFLPHTTLFSHMMLQPPSGQELEMLSQREALVMLDHLLGQRGTTTTPLSPAGKARFDNALVDVLSSGDFISRGTDIEVIEVHGNRIIVRAIDV